MGDLASAFFDPEIFKESIWLLVKTLPVVIEVLVFGVIFSYAWGLVLALIRLSRFKTLRWLSGAYIDFFRGLPLLLLLIFIYSGLAIAGIRLTSLMSAVLALTLCYGAYSAEIFRAGIQAIPKGQTEAAHSLGMTTGQTMRYVIVPQAVKLVIPPLTNEFIAMIKDTALLSVIAVPEILFTAKEKMGVVANPTPLTVAAIIYVLFTIPLIRLASRLEKRGGRRPVAAATPEVEIPHGGEMH